MIVYYYVNCVIVHLDPDLVITTEWSLLCKLGGRSVRLTDIYIPYHNMYEDRPNQEKNIETKVKLISANP